MGSTRTIRLFLLVEAASYMAAASVHFGIVTQGYEHRAAGTGESVIAVALVVGLALTWTGWVSVRALGLAAQGFALFVTLIGLFTIAIGVGPRTLPDLVYHLSIVGVLIVGLVAAARAPGSVR